MDSCIATTRNIFEEAWTAVTNCNKCNKIVSEEVSDLNTDRKSEETLPLNDNNQTNKSTRSNNTAISQQPSLQLPPTQNIISATNTNDSTLDPTNTNNPTTNTSIANDSTNTNSQPNLNNPTNTFNPTNISNATFNNTPTFINKPVTHFKPETNVKIYLDTKGLEDILLKTSFEAINEKQLISRKISTTIQSIIKWKKSSMDTVDDELIDRAVVGGYDADDTDLLIIRSKYKGEVIPGKLNFYHRLSFALYEIDNGYAEKNTDESFEVCCVDPENIERIKWIKCSGGEVPKNAVEAGRKALSKENMEKLYIGRCIHKDKRYKNVKSLCPGMIQPSHGVLYITYGLTVYAYRNYEVMCID